VEITNYAHASQQLHRHTHPSSQHSLGIVVRGPHAKWTSVSLNVLDNEHICSIAAQAETELVQKMKRQGHMIAADQIHENNLESREIDILKGVDHIWEICQDSTIKI
jgi:hypothetical protein